jgi:hypothetical protein
VRDVPAGSQVKVRFLRTSLNRRHPIVMLLEVPLRPGFGIAHLALRLPMLPAHRILFLLRRDGCTTFRELL